MYRSPTRRRGLFSLLLLTCASAVCLAQRDQRSAQASPGANPPVTGPALAPGHGSFKARDAEHKASFNRAR
jgi:hypothetical protein